MCRWVVLDGRLQGTVASLLAGLLRAGEQEQPAAAKVMSPLAASAVQACLQPSRPLQLLAAATRQSC